MKRFIALLLVLAAAPALATTVMTVNPGGGADYVSLQDANDHLPNPLDDNYEIHCAGATDDTYALIAPKTLNGATQYTLLISGNWTGAAFDDSKYQINTTGTNIWALQITSGYVTVEGVQIRRTAGTPYGALLINGASHVTIRNCYAEGYTATGGSGYEFYGAGTNRLIYNCIATNCYYGARLYWSQGDLYNSTFSACTSTGLYLKVNLSSNNIVKNNLSKGSASKDYDVYVSAGGYTLTTATNYTADGTSPDADCNNATITFAGTGDYHLDSTAMLGSLTGTDLHTIFTTDIDGDTRSAWYAGVDELISAWTPTGTGGGHGRWNKLGNKQ